MRIVINVSPIPAPGETCVPDLGEEACAYVEAALSYYPYKPIEPGFTITSVTVDSEP